MFTGKKLMFFYAVTPVHMGVGQALGVIDNPIQRERHTEHPCFAGSGIKGAFRHASTELWKNGERLTDRIFGPEREASEHAGAVSFTDALLLLFPVRSLKGVYVYAASPLSLQRLARLAAVAGVEPPSIEELPKPKDDTAFFIADDIIMERDGSKHLVLESFLFKAEKDTEQLAEIARWIAERVVPEDKAFSYFREKMTKHLVLLSDDQLTYFARNATTVEPHVRINDLSGTADEGGLFFTENLPPESVLVALLMASEERYKKGSDPSKDHLTAEKVIEKMVETFDKKPLQIGGDATTGRGQVVVSFVGDERR